MELLFFVFKMAEISAEMLRRKAEHNDKEISTLEELSLHQENISKIDFIQNCCRQLQILLLQSNLISKIENLNKLKKLRYLNLALNNIERVENLEGLESLEKLDLTLNFIGDVQSIASLATNIHLRILILTGNPCCDFPHYRDFVVTKLQQLSELDGQEISRSERILAKQGFQLKLEILETSQRNYYEKRNKDKKEEEFVVDDETDPGFWDRPSKNTPEERVRLARMAQKSKAKDEPKQEKPKEVRLFNKDGKPLNVNQAKIPFRCYDDEDGFKILDIAVYKYLDSSFLTVDVQPLYVQVQIKGKYLQIVFEDEINVGNSVCCRSMTTGHLEIKMPLLRKILVPKKKTEKARVCTPKCSVLEIAGSNVDLRIVKKDWEDDPDVPPLV